MIFQKWYFNDKNRIFPYSKEKLPNKTTVDNPKDKVSDLLVNFLNKKRFSSDENNNEVRNRGKKRKIEPGTRVSIENLNVLIEEAAINSKGNKGEKVGLNTKIT